MNNLKVVDKNYRGGSLNNRAYVIVKKPTRLESLEKSINKHSQLQSVTSSIIIENQNYSGEEK